MTDDTPQRTRAETRRARLTVAVWLVLAAVCVPFAFQLSGALTTGGVTNPRGDSVSGQRTLAGAFAEPPNQLQVVLHDPDGDVTTIVGRIGEAAAAVPNVVSVVDYRQHPEWLAPDRHTTFVQLGLSTDSDASQDLVPRLRTEMAAVAGGVEVNVTGAPALDRDLTTQVLDDASTAEMIAFPLLLVLLLLVFRSVVAMVVPLVLAGIALVTTRAAGYALAQVTDVSVMYTSAASIIGLAVAVDYSLFIVKRYRDELAAGADERAALRTAMRTAGRSVVFSGLAVVVALAALFIPRMVFFTSIGLAGIAVTAISVAMSMTLLPAILLLLGRNIDRWPLRFGRRAGGGGARRLFARVVRRPVPLLLTLVAVFGLCAWPITDIRMQIVVAGTEMLPAGSDARQGSARLTAELDPRGLFPLQVVLSSPAEGGPGRLLESVRSTAGLAGELRATESVQAVTEIGLPEPALTAAVGGDPGLLPPPARQAFGQLWARDGDLLVSRVVVVPAESPNSNATHVLVRELRDRLDDVVAPGVDHEVTGATAHGVDFDDGVVGSLPAILGAVALVTLVLLASAFRSVLLPLLSLVLNTLVVGASLGLLTLIAQFGLGQSINSTTPVLLFAVMFGLSMDYLVIMISRMREHYLSSGNHRVAVTEGLARTSGLVNGAAMIMVAVFAAFLTAKISVVQQLGMGLAIAVLLDALVVRLLVMPSALLLLGPRIWGRVSVTHAPTPATPDRAPAVG